MESLKSMRLQCGMTRRDVASRIGVTEATLGNWEAGRSEPRASDIVAMCALYRCSADRLLGRRK